MKGERVKINRKSTQKAGARPRAILAVALMSVCREARCSAILSPSEGWPRKWEGQEEGNGVERGEKQRMALDAFVILMGHSDRWTWAAAENMASEVQERGWDQHRDNNWHSEN